MPSSVMATSPSMIVGPCGLEPGHSVAGRKFLPRASRSPPPTEHGPADKRPSGLARLLNAPQEAVEKDVVFAVRQDRIAATRAASLRSAVPAAFRWPRATRPAPGNSFFDQVRVHFALQLLLRQSAARRHAQALGQPEVSGGRAGPLLGSYSLHIDEIIAPGRQRRDAEQLGIALPIPSVTYRPHRPG